MQIFEPMADYMQGLSREWDIDDNYILIGFSFIHFILLICANLLLYWLHEHRHISRKYRTWDYRTRLDYISRLISEYHSIISSIMAIEGLTIPCSSGEYALFDAECAFDGNMFYARWSIAFSLAYFAYDYLLVSLFFPNQGMEDYSMFLHHTIGVYTYLFSIIARFAPSIFMCYQLYELSTPLLNARTFMLYRNKNEIYMYHLVCFIIFLQFVVVRLIFGTWLFILENQIYILNWRKIYSQHGYFFVGFAFHVYTLIYLFFILNIFWFFKVYQLCARHIRPTFPCFVRQKVPLKIKEKSIKGNQLTISIDNLICQFIPFILSMKFIFKFIALYILFESVPSQFLEFYFENIQHIANIYI